MRKQPTFLVIGGQKCGSTSLYHYLEEHPEVFLSPVKELRYFSQELSTRNAAALDVEDIQNFTQYCQYFSAANTHKAIGEVSPSYIFYPGTAERIHEVLPDVKLIAILRNPIDRAFSEYWHHWKMGRRLTKSFERFIETEAIHRSPEVHDYQDCLRRGFYYQQLQPYFKLFPKEQILVLLYDDLRKNPLQLMQSVFSFLGVDPSFKPNVQEIHNPGQIPKKNGAWWLETQAELILETLPIKESKKRYYRLKLRRRLEKGRATPSPALRQKLVVYFKQDIFQLQQFLDKDLSNWLI